MKARTVFSRGITIPIALGLLPFGCSSPSDPEPDPALCQQTYEFQNLGCAEVRGFVTGASGQGLYGWRVGTKQNEETNPCCGSALVTTDSTGYFAFRVFWWALTTPDPDYVADTATVEVFTNRRPDSPSDTISRWDSKTLRIHFSPVGAKAHINWVDLTVGIG